MRRIPQKLNTEFIRSIFPKEVKVGTERGFLRSCVRSTLLGMAAELGVAPGLGWHLALGGSLGRGGSRAWDGCLAEAALVTFLIAVLKHS